MKLGKLHIVEGDPERGGCHVKRMDDVLRLNRAAYLAGEQRGLLVLAAAGSLEEANAIKRGLVSERGSRVDCGTEERGRPAACGTEERPAACGTEEAAVVDGREEMKIEETEE